MSKILFTLAFPHASGDGKEKVSRMPQLIVSTNNLYSIHVSGKDFSHPKFKNANIGKDLKQWTNRFEYAVTGGKNVTRLSLVVNTSAVLPHLTWSSGGPIKIPSMGSSDGRRKGSRRNEADSHHEDPRASRRDSRRPTAYIDDKRRPGGYIEDRKRPARYEDDKRRSERYEDDEKRPGRYIEDRKRPARYDDEKRRPGRYDNDDNREYRRSRRRANRNHVVDDGNVEAEADGGDVGDAGGD